jgi:hypothetical protein
MGVAHSKHVPTWMKLEITSFVLGCLSSTVAIFTANITFDQLRRRADENNRSKKIYSLLDSKEKQLLELHKSLSKLLATSAKEEGIRRFSRLLYETINEDIEAVNNSLFYESVKEASVFLYSEAYLTLISTLDTLRKSSKIANRILSLYLREDQELGRLDLKSSQELLARVEIKTRLMFGASLCKILESKQCLLQKYLTNYWQDFNERELWVNQYLVSERSILQELKETTSLVEKIRIDLPDNFRNTYISLKDFIQKMESNQNKHIASQKT